MTAATRADTANARDSAAVTPARLVWAALDGPDLDAAAVGEAAARELSWLGIDVVLGPVLDVASSRGTRR
jgi:beta-glucosidase-like glycosyl hydrolase